MRNEHRELRIAYCWISAGVLAAVTGALLTIGCERRDDTPDVSAADVREETREAGATARDYTKQQLAELEDRFTAVERDTAREMDEARERAKDVPEATREQLNAAIEHIETARDNARARLDDLKEAGEAGWETARQRAVDALDELSEARREVVAALKGEPTAG